MRLEDKKLGAGRLLIVFVLISLFLHVGIFERKLIDWDEKIYVFLSYNMTWGLSNYTTAGSFVEASLPQAVYKSPVFLHPPLIPYFIKILSLGMNTFVAAKLLNILLIIASVVYMFQIANIFSKQWGALITTGFWIVCPIFNLESYIIHLDFPMTVFVIAGIFHFLYYHSGNRGVTHLALSGIFFSFAMLSKYTGPITVLIPFFLVLFNWREKKLKGPHAILFAAIILSGFSWWFYILIKFGSLYPSAFKGGGSYESAYLASLAKRQWYHIWLYFLCICPLFLLYLVSIGQTIALMFVRARSFFQNNSNEYLSLVAINAASVLYIIIFTIVNMKSNNYWTFRHVMVVFPIIYITLGRLTDFLIRKDYQGNSYIFASVYFTVITMSFSTYHVLSYMTKGNLKAIPPIMVMVPELRKFFY